MGLLLLQIETEGARLQVCLNERGFSDIQEWIISRLVNERG